MKINTINFLGYKSNNPISLHKTRQEKMPLTLEQIKSEDIKNLTRKYIHNYSLLQKDAKYLQSEFNFLIKLGRKNDFKGTIPYKPKEGLNLTFSDINPENNLPSGMTIWNMGEPECVYEISSETNFKMTDFSIPNFRTIYTIQDKKLASCTELNKKDGTFIKFTSTKDGFEYEDTDTQYFHNSSEPEKSLYLDFLSNNIQEYRYDKQKNMWQKTRNY
ncbi:hypothetical protein IJ670_01365 [bacterium]|nr:hypothetical protein [bacterium]